MQLHSFSSAQTIWAINIQNQCSFNLPVNFNARLFYRFCDSNFLYIQVTNISIIFLNRINNIIILDQIISRSKHGFDGFTVFIDSILIIYGTKIWHQFNRIQKKNECNGTLFERMLIWEMTKSFIKQNKKKKTEGKNICLMPCICMKSWKQTNSKIVPFQE